MNCKLADGSLDEAVRLASLSIMMTARLPQTTPYRTRSSDSRTVNSLNSKCHKSDIILYLPTAREGYVFRSVCQSFCPREGGQTP